MAESRPVPLVRAAIAPTLLLAAGAMAFQNCTAGTFLLDDVSGILQDEAIHSVGAMWETTGLPGPLKPRSLVRWSLAVNYHFGANNPWGYHVVNLCVHLFAGLLLYDLLRRTLLLESMPQRVGARSALLAFCIALIWLVHPLQTASVTYIIQRLEAMMGLLFLACIYALLRGSQSARPWPWYLASLVACWMGMAAKEVMIAAPLVALTYDRVFLATRFQEILRRRGALYLGFALAAACLIGAYADDLLAAQEAPGRSPTRLSTANPTRAEFLRTQPEVILHYLRLCFWPDRLCLDYHWQAAMPVEAIAPAAIVLVMIAASVVGFWFWPKAAFLGWAFFVVLMPSSSFWPMDVAFEHRMYLPLVSVVTASVLVTFVVLDRIFARPARWGPTMRDGVLLTTVMSVAVALAVRTYLRNGDYRSPLRMWRNVLKTSWHNARAHSNLGVALEKIGRDEDAIVHYRLAIERIHRPGIQHVHPSHPHLNLGAIYLRRGSLAMAEQQFMLAGRFRALSPQLENNLGIVAEKRGQFAMAEVHYRRALCLKADFAPARHNLRRLSRSQGN